MSEPQVETQKALTITPLQQRAIELREQISAADPVALVPRTFAEAQAFATAIAQSSLVPQALRDNAPNVMMMILAGAEIGIPPVASFRIFHVIEGVPKLSADGIAAICQRSSLCEYVEPREQSSTRVTWAAKKRGRPEVTITLTREDMVTAGLYDRKNRDGSPGNHLKYPRQMLNARCKAELCRLVWPEICAGMISAEEQRDIDAIDVEYVEHKSSNFAPLPTTQAKIDTTKLEAPTISEIDAAREERAARRDPTPTVEGEDIAAIPSSAKPADTKPTSLTDDDVALLAEQIKKAPDGKSRAAIAADVSKMTMNEAQRKYLLSVYQKSGGRS